MANDTNETEVTATQNMIQACWLSYDIPETADIESPVAELRPIAFHAQKSVWIIREGDIPYNLVARLQAAGADVQIVRFDPSEAPKLLNMCVNAVRADIRETVDNAKKSCAAAQLRYDNTENPEAAQKRYMQDAKRINKVAAQKLKDLRALAERWNVLSRVDTLAGATVAVQTVNTAMANRAKAYADAIRALRERNNSEDSGIIAEAEASRVPGMVLAGYLEDKGLTTEARRVSKFFD